MKVGKVVDLKSFRGINNVDDPSAVPPNAMVEGTNLFLSAKARVRRRPGKNSVIAGSMHSAFATADQKTLLMVKDNSLVLVNKDFSIKSLRTGMLPGRQISYAEINDEIFYSNASQLGRVVFGSHHNWGIPIPNPPTLTRTGGIMQAGTYGVIATFLRAGGRESGTSAPITIDIPANSGIQISLPSTTDASVTLVALYVTQPDGIDYYRAGFYTPGAASISFQGVLSDVRPGTMFKGPPIAGQALAYFSGVCLIAVGDVLYWTDPYSYELVDYSTNYKQLPDWIDIVAPVEDGVYLSYGGKIGFMRGRDLKAAELVTLTPYGSTPGTLTYVDGITGIDIPSKKIAVWSSEHGVVAGFDGGQLVNLTENYYRAGKYKGGAAIYLQRGGDQIYLATHRGNPVVQGDVRAPSGIDIENRGPN